MRLFTPTFGSRRHYGGSVRRKILPPAYAINVVRLTCESTAEGGECEVYVVGTTHNSPVVFLELCSSRTGILYPPKVHTLRFGPITWKFTRYKDQVDSEFRVAFKEANKIGVKVILGDRPIEITRKRYHDKICRMPWHTTKMEMKLVNMVPLTPRYDPEKVMNRDDIHKSTFHDVIVVDERDQYMSAKLLEVAREHSSIIAVVGKGHLLGIQKYWKQPVEMKQLLSVPPPVYRNRMIMGALLIFLITLQYFL